MEIPGSTNFGTRLHVGTSGWQYDHWRGPFYPQDLPKKRWLAFYARRLACVEINNSFYRFPSPKAIRGWLDADREVWLFFDNDEAGYAVQDALRISAMLGETGASRPGRPPKAANRREPARSRKDHRPEVIPEP